MSLFQQRLVRAPVFSSRARGESGRQPAMDMVIQQGFKLGDQRQALTGTLGGAKGTAAFLQKAAALALFLRGRDQNPIDVPQNQSFLFE